jgi:PAS domain S-box-containing protein
MQADIAQHRQRPDLRLTVRGGAIALAAVAGGVLVASWVQPLLDGETLLLLGVLVAARFGGLGSGLLACLLATLALDYFFISPLHQFGLAPGQVPRPAAFVLLTVFFAVLVDSRQRAERALKVAHDDMESRVHQRTAELQQVNEQLRSEIADRRRADEALREKASLLNLTHDSIFVRRVEDDVITYWNRGAESLYGWTAGQTVGRVSHELLLTIFPAPIDEINARLVSTGRWEGELVHTKADGDHVVVASRWALLPDSEGNPLAVLETNNDITASKRAEQALRQQANLLEQTHDAIFVWDFRGTIVYWNRGAEQLYGFSREEATGRRSHDLLHTEHPMPTAAFESALERDAEWTGELVHTTRSGQKIIVESRHMLLLEADGRRLVLETNRDITERKRAEQALEELAGRLITAQEEERRRIGRELHDHISQMLGVLTVKIDQLRAENPAAPDLAAALDDLRRDSTQITNDVHRLSHRLHSSMLDYLGLVPALQKLVSEFSERNGIGITFAHTSLPASLPPDVALCLFRVVEESLTNIAKHSKAPSAAIHLTGGADGIRLRIEDAGTGFDMALLAGRPGLGFISMQERLRVLHGGMRVESGPSRGTRIDAWVPAMPLPGAAQDTFRTEPA